MTVFGYVESHRGRWTISATEANERYPANAERSSYDHLVQLSRETLDAENRRIISMSADWADLTPDVLILAQPEDSYDDPDNGADMHALLSFVQAGGGLFIIAGSGEAMGESIATKLARSVGVHITNRPLFSASADSECLLSDAVVCEDISAHHAMRGIRQVICHRGVELRCTGESQAIISTPVGETVFAAAAYGSGMVAVIGSGEMFALPYIGEADNAVLYLNTLAWLAGTREGPAAETARADIVRRLIRETDYYPRLRGHGLPRTPRSMPSVTVSKEKRELMRLYRMDLDPYQGTADFLRQAELTFHELPQFVRREVLRFRDESNDVGALLVRGLPPDPVLPPTPQVPDLKPIRRTYMSEFWLAVFSSALGDQAGYAQEGGGTLFQNIVPTKANAANLSSESSQVALGLHTEVAFHPVMPDYLLLYCLRPAPYGDARTLVAGVRSMVTMLPPRHRNSLFRPVFRTGIDHSYGSPNGRAGNGPVISVFHGDPFDPLMRLDPDLMVGEDAEACAALREIESAGELCAVSTALESSDLLLIDNRRAVHGRSTFCALYDGNDRWLQRSFVLRDLCRFSAERKDGGRVISTAFAI